MVFLGCVDVIPWAACRGLNIKSDVLRGGARTSVNGNFV